MEVRLFITRGAGVYYGVEIDKDIFIITNKFGEPIISKSGRMLVYDNRRKIRRKACEHEEEMFRKMFSYTTDGVMRFYKEAMRR